MFRRGVLVDDRPDEYADLASDLDRVGLQPQERRRPAALDLRTVVNGKQPPRQGCRNLRRRNDVGYRPGVGVERRLGAVPAHHHLALVVDAGGVMVHRPVERVGPDDLCRRDVPERPLDDGPRLGPGLTAVVAGHDLEVAVRPLLHEHQQLAVDHERPSLLVGQRRQVGPGLAAVGAADDPQRPSHVRASPPPTAAPRRSGCRRRVGPGSGRGRNRA